MSVVHSRSKPLLRSEADSLQLNGLGVTYRGVISNAKYKSQRIISEFLQVIATQLEEKQLQNALSSDYFSLLIDETTDIAVINEMVIYARYMYNGSVATTFLKICELFDGTANTIELS